MVPRTPPPDEPETDPRFPSGKWTGFWTQKVPFVGRPRQEMVLTFHRGTITGEGRDMVGQFLVRGFYSVEDGKCRWTKRYIGRHDVAYHGFAEGKGIWGVWEIDPLRGGFHIWPEGMSDPSVPVMHAEADVPVEQPVEIGEPVPAG